MSFSLRLGLTLLVLIGILAAGTARAQTLRKDSLYAASLDRVMRVHLLLPRLHSSNQRWPGFVLLHGFNGDETNWSTLTDLRQLTSDLPLVIVMPQADNRWYANSASEPDDRYEDYLMIDLRRWMARKYGVDTTRLSVGGFSMGGFGALTLSLRHPRSFRFVVPLSASLDIPVQMPLLEERWRHGMRPELERAFGRESSDVWLAYDPFSLASTIDTAGAPYFFVVTGIQDEFLDRILLHRQFAEILRKRGLQYEYREIPGKHSWEYVDRAFRQALQRWRELELPRNSARRTIRPTAAPQRSLRR